MYYAIDGVVDNKLKYITFNCMAFNINLSMFFSIVSIFPNSFS